MITCKNVCFSYCSNREDTDVSQNDGTLKNISCSIEDGSFVLLCGASGCGKTTLTRLFNGLIPHYYEGELSGQVLLDGKAYKDLSLFEISEKVGSVFQNPRSQFFNVDTTSELAFGPENHGLPEAGKNRKSPAVLRLLLSRMFLYLMNHLLIWTLMPLATFEDY